VKTHHVASALLLGLFWLVFAASLYADFHIGSLSKEAQEYQSAAAEVNFSGIDLRFGAQKLCFLIGVAMLIGGSALVAVRHRAGVILFTLAALPLVATIPLGESEPYYPLIESLAARTLWCLAAALWSAVATLAWVDRAASAKKSEHAA